MAYSIKISPRRLPPYHPLARPVIVHLNNTALCFCALSALTSHRSSEASCTSGKPSPSSPYCVYTLPNGLNATGSHTLLQTSTGALSTTDLDNGRGRQVKLLLNHYLRELSGSLGLGLDR